MVNKGNASVLKCHPYDSDHLESWNNYTSSSYLEWQQNFSGFLRLPVGLVLMIPMIKSFRKNLFMYHVFSKR